MPGKISSWYTPECLTSKEVPPDLPNLVWLNIVRSPHASQHSPAGIQLRQTKQTREPGPPP